MPMVRGWVIAIGLLGCLCCGGYVSAAQAGRLTKTEQAAIVQLGKSLLIRPGDFPTAFGYPGGGPGVDVTSATRWWAVASLCAQPNVSVGVDGLYMEINRYATEAAARARVPGEIVNAKEGIVDPHSIFLPTHRLTGVTYLRLITLQVDVWHADYDVIFRQGVYVNKIAFSVFLTGPRDTVFGIAGLNRYISLVLERERAHP